MLPSDVVFLMIDFKRLVSGSWPLTTGEMSAPLLGGGHDAALSRRCGPLPLDPDAWTGAVAGTSSDCGEGTVIVCMTHQHNMLSQLEQTVMLPTECGINCYYMTRVS